MPDLSILLKNRQIEKIIYVDHCINNFILFPYNGIYIPKLIYNPKETSKDKALLSLESLLMILSSKPNFQDEIKQLL